MAPEAIREMLAALRYIVSDEAQQPGDIECAFGTEFSPALRMMIRAQDALDLVWALQVGEVSPRLPTSDSAHIISLERRAA